jgi:hypothetical protein
MTGSDRVFPFMRLIDWLHRAERDLAEIARDFSRADLRESAIEVRGLRRWALRHLRALEIGLTNSREKPAFEWPQPFGDADTWAAWTEEIR